MMITYDTHVKPFGKNFQLVEIDPLTINRIDEFAKSIINEKQKESHHQMDNKAHYKRYYTGTLGEAALEKYLNVTGIIDWSIGHSIKYHQPDLKGIGINAGIKTVDYGLFPVVFKKSFSSEVIMIRWKERFVYICGLATPDIIHKYQSLDLIKDPRLRNRGVKTGFYGFEHLKKFNNIDELKALTQNRKKHF